jgi:hypothetical protein
MKKLKPDKTYLILGFLILLGCRETQSNYNCTFVASTPTELTLVNNTDQEVEVVMRVQEDKLNKFREFRLVPNESTTVCIDYEGAILNGIHVEFENQTTVIKLIPQLSNKFTLKERVLK